MSERKIEEIFQDLEDSVREIRRSFDIKTKAFKKLRDLTLELRNLEENVRPENVIRFMRIMVEIDEIHRDSQNLIDLVDGL